VKAAAGVIPDELYTTEPIEAEVPVALVKVRPCKAEVPAVTWRGVLAELRTRDPVPVAVVKTRLVGLKFVEVPLVKFKFPRFVNPEMERAEPVPFVKVMFARLEEPETVRDWETVVVARLAVVETTRFGTERVPVAETEARTVLVEFLHSVRLAV